jgi:branched-chain amino acid transport system permease protein
MFLTMPIMVIRVNTIEKTVQWRWMNMLYMGVGVFFLSWLWRFALARRAMGKKPEDAEHPTLSRRILEDRRKLVPLVALGALFALAFPYLFSSYQTNIMISAMTYVVLGLGLNIVVGLAGLLVLGYVAFSAVGAYAYALLNLHYGLNFWLALPVGAGLAALFGLLLGFPVLRLRGDYLAIVTLGFGEIIRLVLENWSDFSHGPSGVSNIPRPTFFGYKFSVEDSIVFVYYLMIVLVLFTVFVVSRIKSSRIGRALEALREDEIACQAMGIDKAKTKLMAFAVGAAWAGMAGVVFAAKTTFINPASFTFLESAFILSVVVLGGMGSVPGVVLGAMAFVLIPEYMRTFSEYRMLLFGATMILFMVFRPQGLIGATRKKFDLKGLGKPSPYRRDENATGS